jgi:hypothetical protein
MTPIATAAGSKHWACSIRSGWATGVLSQVTLGRFYHDVQGVQAESMLFVPNTDDLIRVRGAAYNQAPGGLAGNKDKAPGRQLPPYADTHHVA